MLGPGRPLLETIKFGQVICTVELNSGVLAHAAARRLDRAGWRIEEGLVCESAVDVPSQGEVSALFESSCGKLVASMRKAISKGKGDQVVALTLNCWPDGK